ncbi:DEDD exonuclease domain-containing protein [Litorihabitans aurantiacus]|uniref:DNA polymerase III epsilon subunit n=1 Tax=Litorihabitans aurantiacus TaxID=1930061 RepID=A0AA38CTJ1_9MICO|nr:DEDD exonuclease domain-containing protein [Litorihabitans aurantiacus]GMA31480.1 putative DNA polymerase III epsilon subunit [Litorihabitans aurantiacus]
MTTAPAPQLALQPSLLADGLPLHEVEFVVVDLETTGGSPHADRITEIGAVRVRGGVVLGELGTLVNPGRAIPPQITVLTGITDAMVVDAPGQEDALVTFGEFARGAVLVAHNARFDVGFLRAGFERMGATWPAPPVVDTVALARRVVTRDEAPNHKLGSLARLFAAGVVPDHRALTDARATVDVLHGLLGRLAPLGVTHLEDLVTASDPVPEARRRKVTLADGLPSAPGVYQFLDGAGRILYVGTATDLRTRVRSYFTASEKRRRMTEMVTVAARVHPIVCATPLEASIRELRLIAQHRPPYNRRSRSPSTEPWIRLTDEAFPRASIVRTVPLTQTSGVLGPFRNRAQAVLALEAIQGTFGLRACTARLPARPAAGASACALADLGRCAAPCIGGTTPQAYAGTVSAFAAFCDGDGTGLLNHAARRIAELSAQQRYEEAARERDRVQALLRGAQRAQRLRTSRPRELVAARPTPAGWEVVVARHGRLAASAVTRRAADVLTLVAAMIPTAEDVPEPTTWAGAALVEETELLARWWEQPGVRLIALSDGPALARPVRGADHALSDLAARLGAAPSPDRDGDGRDAESAAA